jgi:hypothetical protein
MNFDSKQKLLHAIDILNQFKVPISEVYISEYTPMLQQKLRAKRFNWKAFILRFGLFGGAVVAAFAHYLFKSRFKGDFNQINYKGPALSLTISVMLFILAYIFSSKATKIRRLSSNDQKYLLAVKFESTIQEKQVKDLIKYYRGIKMSEDIKHMIIG